MCWNRRQNRRWDIDIWGLRFILKPDKSNASRQYFCDADILIWILMSPLGKARNNLFLPLNRWYLVMPTPRSSPWHGSIDLCETSPDSFKVSLSKEKGICASGNWSLKYISARFKLRLKFPSVFWSPTTFVSSAIHDHFIRFHIIPIISCTPGNSNLHRISA